jgi:hypothetical protein
MKTKLKTEKNEKKKKKKKGTFIMFQLIELYRRGHFNVTMDTDYCELLQ